MFIFAVCGQIYIKYTNQIQIQIFHVVIDQVQIQIQMHMTLRKACI